MENWQFRQIIMGQVKTAACVCARKRMACVMLIITLVLSARSHKSFGRVRLAWVKKLNTSDALHSIDVAGNEFGVAENLPGV